jgi:7-carboxy-7-deazaguanine synthase
MTEQTYAYSEIFDSIQGEGHYTGRPTAWLRFFLCNLQCNGFGQDDPTDPSTFKLPYKDFDLIDIKRMEDLPVWEYGCDSSYSWSKKFKHLQRKGTATEIADKVRAEFTNEWNNGRWGERHMCLLAASHL